MPSITGTQSFPSTVCCFRLTKTVCPNRPLSVDGFLILGECCFSLAENCLLAVARRCITLHVFNVVSAGQFILGRVGMISTRFTNPIPVEAVS
jgi:hypothetical protein